MTAKLEMLDTVRRHCGEILKSSAKLPDCSPSALTQISEAGAKSGCC